MKVEEIENPNPNQSRFVMPSEIAQLRIEEAGNTFGTILVSYPIMPCKDAYTRKLVIENSKDPEEDTVLRKVVLQTFAKTKEDLEHLVKGTMVASNYGKVKCDPNKPGLWIYFMRPSFVEGLTPLRALHASRTSRHSFLGNAYFGCVMYRTMVDVFGARGDP